MVEIRKPDGATITTKNDVTWARAVYREVDGYRVREIPASRMPCECKPGRVCNPCYGRAYERLYSR